MKNCPLARIPKKDACRHGGTSDQSSEPSSYRSDPDARRNCDLRDCSLALALEMTRGDSTGGDGLGFAFAFSFSLFPPPFPQKANKSPPPAEKPCWNDHH